MLGGQPTALSTSSSSSSSTTLFRVRRKRTADPHDALVISLKRPKKTAEAVNEPIICLRTTATDLRLGTNGVTQPQQINVIEVDPQGENSNEMETQPINIGSAAKNGGGENSVSNYDLLELFQNAPEETPPSHTVVGEVTIKPSQVTLNGIPLAVLCGQDDEEFIFDYYWSSKADGYAAHDIGDVRLANPDDLLLYDGEDTESSVEDDDEDEDSNAENNWRNDYPDESEHTSGCGSDEDTMSDGFNDYDDLERHMGELGFYGEEGHGEVYSDED